MKIKHYKLRDGIAKEDLEAAGFHSGSWQRKDDHEWMSMWRPLYDEIEIDIDVDLTTREWDDFENVLVMDDDFGQPYTPFYNYLNGKTNLFQILEHVVDAYNNFMDTLVKQGVLAAIPATDDLIDAAPKALHIVAVKHKPEQKKNYWFEVPEKLVPLIQNGTTVLCNTRRGQQSGVAQTDVYYVDVVNRLAEYEGARLPLRKIIGVRKEIPMRGIKIGSHLETSYPSKNRMIQRLKEFYDCGAFCTRVVVDSAGWLIDDYSAYLVAKMFGLTSIPIWIHSAKEI